MKKFLHLLSITLLVGFSLFLSTCKKDEPNKPTITSLSPSTGHEGDVVVIKGTFLGTTHKIRFGAQEGVIIDPKGTEVTTQVPAGAPIGSVDISVEAEGGLSNSMSFTVIAPAPEITSINPIKGGAGATVVITGKYFTTATEVAFGATKVTTFAPKTETQIGLTIPDGLPIGATDVTVTSPSGVSNKITFTVLAKPTIASFTPTFGPAGSHLFITGTTLEETSQVTIGGIIAPAFTITSATLLDVTIPVGALTGKIKVVTPGGEALSATDYTVKGAPVVTSFAPTSGIVGASIVITGENFSVAGATVKIGNTTVVTQTVSNDVTINILVPAGAQTGKISVTTAAGTGTSANDFTVIHPPTITSFTPTSGFIGNTVAITGTNLTGTTLLKFNGIAAGTFTVNSPTQITATVPVGATTGTISAQTPAGIGTSSTPFTIIGAPTVTNFSPASGAVGSSVTITGTNFVQVSSVKFAGTEVGAANFTVNSATSISAKVPVGAANGVITVTNPAGPGSSANPFTIINGPTVTGFSPTSGAVGATVVITGTNLTAASIVKFNTTAATSFTINSSTQITATVPTGASNGPISVTTGAGTGTSATSFTVIGAPTVTNFTPTSGAVGASIVITGTNFIGVNSVKFNSTDVLVANYTVNSATQITAKVPVGATSGVISVGNAAGTGASANSFTVIGPPVVTSFNPTSGAVGQTVVVTGTGFVSVTAVKFNGVAAITYTVNSTTQITVTIPAGATTGKISVENAAGPGVSAANFTVAPAPTVTTFTPTSGAVGATITINGTNFVNVSSVKFNGTESGLANITVLSPTQLTAKVPAGAATGTISVTTPSGIGTSAGTFTVIVAPTISGFTPSGGVAGTSVVITGTFFTGTTAVKFNGVNATGFTVNSATSITATAPVGVTTGIISVTNPAGTANSASSFTVIQAPLIGSISPISATVGTTLTILGSNLGSAISVKFDAVTVTTFISNNPSQVQVTIPSLSLGAHNVTVVTAGGTSNSKTLTIIAAPVISDIKPNVSYKGFPIMVRGSNLAGTISAKVGTYDATIMTVYDATVMITLPGNIPNGGYTLTLSNEGGPSNGVSLNIITAPGSAGSPPSGTFINPPPANYINPVSNFWREGPDSSDPKAFFLVSPGTVCQIESGDDQDNPQPDSYYVCGSYTFTKDGTGKVTANYVEITRGTPGNPPTNLETFYGQWSATDVNNCFAKLVLISAKDGHVLIAYVQVNFDSDCIP